MIILNLIQNIALLMALVMTQQLLANRTVVRRLRRYPLISSVFSGLVFGGLGIIGMMTPLHFAPGIIFDGRSIILSVAGLFGGPLVAAVAASLCGAYRLWVDGAGGLMGISVICEAAALGVVFHYLWRRNLALITNFRLLGFGFLVHAVMVGMMMLLPAEFRWDVLGRVSLPVLLLYPVATMLFCRLIIDQQNNIKNKIALDESEKNYRELVENANSIILRWTPDGSITFLNKFAENIFGFSREEILGRSVFGTIVAECDSANNDLRAMVFDIARNPEKYAINENENIRKDGSRLWISWTNRAIRDAEGNITGILAIGNDITERKKMEEELCMASQKWRATFDAMLYPVALLSSEGIVEQCNRAFADFTGLDFPALLGRKCSRLIHGTDDHIPGCPIVKSRESGMRETMELTAGEKIIMIVADPIKDPGGTITGFVHIMHDITERKQAEKAMRKSELHFRLLFESSRDGFVSVDENGHFIDANQRYCQMLGYSIDELKLKDFSSVTPEKWRDWEREEIWQNQLLKNGFSDVYEKEYMRKDGSVFPVELQAFVVHEETWQSYYWGIARDITERKEAEKAMLVKNAELERFTYSVSHDLRSPLITIRTFMGHLAEDMKQKNDQRMAEDMGYINGASQKMDEQLEELLKLSRIGRMVNSSVEAPLRDIVREALLLVAGRIDQRGVRLQITEKPVLLYGDQVRLIEVFMNLVDNAVKFMGEQKEPLIEIGSEKKNGDIVCFVRDNGMGIDPRHKDRLFGLFEKLNSGMEGSGIGLALVKRIVEAHGGKIWAESEGVGKGACFYFTLPRKSSES